MAKNKLDESKEVSNTSNNSEIEKFKKNNRQLKAYVILFFLGMIVLLYAVLIGHRNMCLITFIVVAFVANLIVKKMRVVMCYKDTLKKAQNEASVQKDSNETTGEEYNPYADIDALEEAELEEDYQEELSKKK